MQCYKEILFFRGDPFVQRIAGLKEGESKQRFSPHQGRNGGAQEAQGYLGNVVYNRLDGKRARGF